LNSYFLFKDKMSRRAMIMGIASIVTAFMSMPFISVPLASFAILFAILSKGGSYKLSKDARTAVYTACIGIFLAVAITAKVSNALATDEEYRNNVAQLADTLYGDDYQEVYGESFSDMLNRMFSERTE